MFMYKSNNGSISSYFEDLRLRFPVLYLLRLDFESTQFNREKARLMADSIFIKS